MPTGYGDQLPALLKTMMQKEPEKRPTAQDILKHQYFRGAKAPPPLPPKVCFYVLLF